MKIYEVYKTLLKHFGKQNWWPAHEHKSNDMKRWEIVIGAILTQNTNWRNVEKAIENLIKGNALSPKKILELSNHELERLIRPSGFYKQKAMKLKNMCRFVLTFKSLNNFFKNVKRDELLSIKGVGPETADSILLYACDKLYFVVDAYTRRIFSRLGMINGSENYDELRRFFEMNLPKRLDVYKEFHALIVELGKSICKKKPLCDKCTLKRICFLYRNSNNQAKA